MLITGSGPLVLRTLILQAVLKEQAEATRADEFGRRYQVDVPASIEAGTAIIRTAWMIRTEEDFPRLTTCYVLER